jgi:hypothetical protein
MSDFLWSYAGSIKLYAPFLKERRTRGRVRGCVQEIRGISLVFREMWDTTNLNLFSDLRQRHVERCGIPHLAKNERDMGHPTLCGRRKTAWPNLEV